MTYEDGPGHNGHVLKVLDPGNFNNSFSRDKPPREIEKRNQEFGGAKKMYTAVHKLRKIMYLQVHTRLHANC